MEVNNRKRKSNKFPATPLAFYIKIYCKQKASLKTKYTTKLIEATKSWLSLSDTEKQEVDAKYNDCRQKYKLRFIDQLKTAEPFMKAKDISLNNSGVGTPNSTTSQLCQEQENVFEQLGSPGEPVEPLEQTTELDLVYDEQDSNIHEVQNEENEKTDENNESTCIAEPSPPSLSNQVQNEENEKTDGNANNEKSCIAEPLPPSLSDQNENTVESCDRNENNVRNLIEEPLPPTFKTGKDLFEMLSTCTYSENEADKITWTSLPQLERNQYSRAVCLLKKDYLNKYRKFLESLSSNELFNHYHKTIV